MAAYNTEKADILPVRIDVFRGPDNNVQIRIADNLDSVLLSWDKDCQEALKKAKHTLTELLQKL